MDNKLYKSFQSFIKTSCANYCSENFCVPLDKECPMMKISKDEYGQPIYKFCSYFKEYVLPIDEKLLHDFVSNTDSSEYTAKVCVICGKNFIPKDGRATTCSECKKLDGKMKKIKKKFSGVK